LKAIDNQSTIRFTADLGHAYSLGHIVIGRQHCASLIEGIEHFGVGIPGLDIWIRSLDGQDLICPNVVPFDESDDIESLAENPDVSLSRLASIQVSLFKSFSLLCQFNQPKDRDDSHGSMGLRWYLITSVSNRDEMMLGLPKLTGPAPSKSTLNLSSDMTASCS
jgi:hypothetical protein